MVLNLGQWAGEDVDIIWQAELFWGCGNTSAGVLISLPKFVGRRIKGLETGVGTKFPGVWNQAPVPRN
jgi:hypothetical protein